MQSKNNNTMHKKHLHTKAKSCRFEVRTIAMIKEECMSDLVERKGNQVSTSVAQEMISVIAEVAKDKDADISKMERLLEVQIKMMDRQAEIDFNQAFHALRSELPVIEQKGAIENKARMITSRYSRYEDLHAQINPLLHKHGFTFSHNTEPHNNMMVIISTLSHIGGHNKSYKFVTPMDSSNALKSPMQAARSTSSFGKRTNLINALDITEATSESEVFNNQTISVDQAQELEEMVKNSGSDREKFLQYCGVENMLDVTLQKYAQAKNQLTAKLGKQL